MFLSPSSNCPIYCNHSILVGEGYAGGPEPPAPYALYQVSLSLTADKARRHELGSLEAAMARTGIDEGTVVTLRESEDVSLAQGVAHVIPAWRWFLER